MDPQLAALAATAGQELVKAMVSEGWPRIRDTVAGWFARGDSERQQRQARQLEETRAAVSGGELQAVAASGRWQGRFEGLLDDHPELAEGLTELVERLRETVAAGATTAGDHALAVSGDVHIRGEHSGVAAGVIHGAVSTGYPPKPGPAQG